MPIELLAPGLEARAAQLQQAFQTAQPFPHLVIEEFLDPAFCATLAGAFPAFDSTVARNELGEVGGKAVFTNLPALGEPYRRLDQLLSSREFLRWLGAATGIPDLLYDPEYVGGGAHLNLNGQELDSHVDFNYHPRTRTHRRLNLILFLNERWEADWGGCLELLQDPERPPDQRVTPKRNRAVLFETSERSWHGFERIAMPEEEAWRGRQSVAVYFYTKSRPPEESAPSHGTFYLPRPLPERFQPGYTLTEEDAGVLALAIARRDQQIRMLYKRELDWMRVLDSLTWRVAEALTWPIRKIRGSV